MDMTAFMLHNKATLSNANTLNKSSRINNKSQHTQVANEQHAALLHVIGLFNALFKQRVTSKLFGSLSLWYSLKK